MLHCFFGVNCPFSFGVTVLGVCLSTGEAWILATLNCFFESIVLFLLDRMFGGFDCLFQQVRLGY